MWQSVVMGVGGSKMEILAWHNYLIIITYLMT